MKTGRGISFIIVILLLFFLGIGLGFSTPVKTGDGRDINFTQVKVKKKYPTILKKSGPWIKATKPVKILDGDPPRQVRIIGSGFIPAGSSLNDLKYQTVYMRVGKQGPWTFAKLVIPSTYGWGANAFTADYPSLRTAPGVLQIRVAVKGVGSNIFEVPIIPKPPATKPKITSISPSETAFGSTAYYYILKVYGTGIDGSTIPRFQGQEGIPFVRNLLEGRVQFSVPKQFRNKPGRYMVQLKNKKGYSNFAFWDLVIKPEIKKLHPPSISQSQITPSSPPLQVKIDFAKSPPKKVFFRVDNKSWQHIPEKKIISYSVHVKINVATLNIQKLVEFKLANKAGESNVKRMNVLVKVGETEKKDISFRKKKLKQKPSKPKPKKKKKKKTK